MVRVLINKYGFVNFEFYEGVLQNHAKLGASIFQPKTRVFDQKEFRSPRKANFTGAFIVRLRIFIELTRSRFAMRLITALFSLSVFSAAAAADLALAGAGHKNSWESLLRSSDGYFVANGNVFPPSPRESRDDCLLIASHNKIIRTCPFRQDSVDEVVYMKEDHRFRGIFAAEATLRDETPSMPRRLWVLASPNNNTVHLLEEIDTQLGKVVQTLRIPAVGDAHDAVRVGDAVFIVDTSHGDVVEVDLPPSVPVNQSFPFSNDESLVDNPEWNKFLKTATVRKRHHAFSAADHINNVAVHPNYLLASLHGKAGLKRRLANQKRRAPTRHSLVSRQEDGEIEIEDLKPVENAGQMCHGIAFWRDTRYDQDPDEATIHLVTLDSKHGSLVTVAMVGPGSEERDRRVLWTPDLSHPVFDGKPAFAKGLAVQDGVAIFGVSKAASRQWRRSVERTLLVAVDLATGEELWTHTLESQGLVNQIVSESYLTNHLHNIDEDIEKEYPGLTVADLSRPGQEGACVNDQGKTISFDVAKKQDLDPNEPAKYVCTLEVSAVAEKLLSEWQQTWYDKDYVRRTNAEFANKEKTLRRWKPGTKAAVLIFSSREYVFHFPWLEHWLPILQDTVLEPLQIDVNRILRMQFALIPQGASINTHVDVGLYASEGHRLHVPIITHDDVYFIAGSRGSGPFIRIPSKTGVAFEFNNLVSHRVRNYGGDRVHLVIDWVDEPVESITRLAPGQICGELAEGVIDCLSDKDPPSITSASRLRTERELRRKKKKSKSGKGSTNAPTGCIPLDSTQAPTSASKRGKGMSKSSSKGRMGRQGGRALNRPDGSTYGFHASPIHRLARRKKGSKSSKSAKGSALVPVRNNIRRSWHVDPFAAKSFLRSLSLYRRFSVPRPPPKLLRKFPPKLLRKFPPKLLRKFPRKSRQALHLQDLSRRVPGVPPLEWRLQIQWTPASTIFSLIMPSTWTLPLIF